MVDGQSFSPFVKARLNLIHFIFQDAEEVFKKMLRKFRDQINPYMKYGKFLYNQKRMDDARELLKKALINLNRTQRKFSIAIKFTCQVPCQMM